ncbi:MAG: ribosomal protein S19 family protein [Candidatus Njordarchaeota archaeon]
MPLGEKEADELIKNFPSKWREFRYRGKSLRELMTMSYEDLAKIAPSRVRRKILRFIHGDGGFTLMEKVLMEKIKKFRNKKSKKPIKTHCRDFIVLPELVGMKFLVHNGKEFTEVRVAPWHIFYRLGDFAPTVKFTQHGGVKKSAVKKK